MQNGYLGVLGVALGNCLRCLEEAYFMVSWSTDYTVFYYDRLRSVNLN